MPTKKSAIRTWHRDGRNGQAWTKPDRGPVGGASE